MNLPDALRYVAMAEACVLLGFAILVMVTASKFRIPGTHIWLIATSYVILIANISADMWAGMGQPGTRRIPIAVISFGFGLSAMYAMYQAYQPATRERRHQEAAEQAAKRLLEQAALAEKAREENDGQSRSA